MKPPFYNQKTSPNGSIENLNTTGSPNKNLGSYMKKIIPNE
jgi:hypothetical protein